MNRRRRTGSFLVTLSAQPEHREVMVILRGRLWAQTAGCGRCRRLRSWHPGSRSVGNVSGVVGIGEPDHDSVDDMHILGSWLARHEGHPAILAIQGACRDP